MYANLNARHRRFIVAGVIALGLVATSTVLVWIGGADDGASTRPPKVSVSANPDSPRSGQGRATSQTDPRMFAIESARTVFEWDTTTSSNTDGYFARLVAIADPGGVESDGLVADLTTYLPTDETWQQLRRYETRQWLEVTAANVPTTWAATARGGEAYGLEHGTTAYTIDGIRHRTGTWGGKPVTTSHKVTFTVFIICGPRYPTCYLLRLSQLDHPLR